MAKIRLAPTDERAGLPSASAFQRYDLCRGSWNAVQSLPAAFRNQSGADAQEGEMLHEQVALRPRADIDANADRRLTHEQRWVLLRAIDADVDFLASIGFIPASQVVEKRFFLHDPMLGRAVASGKFDRIYFTADKTRAVVIDYKFGRGEVEHAVANHQLRFAAAVLGEAYDELQTVVVAINQPRAEGDRFTHAIYNREDLRKAWHEQFDILAYALDPTAARKPSYAACKYCPAKGTGACPESSKAVVELAGLPPSTDPDELADRLKKAKLAEVVIEAWREQARTLLDAGGVVPGWHLKAGQKRKSVTDTERAFQTLSAAGLITPELFVKACTVKLGDLSEIVADTQGMKKAAAASRVEEALRSNLLIDEKTTAPSLAEIKGPSA